MKSNYIRNRQHEFASSGFFFLIFVKVTVLKLFPIGGVFQLLSLSVV